MVEEPAQMEVFGKILSKMPVIKILRSLSHMREGTIEEIRADTGYKGIQSIAEWVRRLCRMGILKKNFVFVEEYGRTVRRFSLNVQKVVFQFQR